MKERKHEMALILTHSLPHAPFSCPACYRLLTPAEQRIADIIRRLVAGAPQNAKWHQPSGTPLCEREDGE